MHTEKKDWGEEEVTDFVGFRQQLDAVLRTRDVQQVRNFLIAKEQWSEELPADPEFAMWMVYTQSELHHPGCLADGEA